MFVDRLVEYISIFLALVLVMPAHEFAHAFVADKFGDDTPRVNGRLTLNPLAHFDVYGLLALMLVHFGWGKPVPVNPNKFKKRTFGCIMVSIAGVLANFLLAFIIYPLSILAIQYIGDFGYFDDVLIYTLYFTFAISLNFFAFNILPLFPLDGFKLLETLHGKGKVYEFLRDYGQKILLALIILGIVAEWTDLFFLDILGMYISFVSGWLSMPITLFWGLFF